MRAIILVGGEGTRLRPLTHRTPKQLAPVLNRPLLEHLLLLLRSADVTAVTLAMTRTRLSEAVRSAFGDGGALGMDLRYVYEETPLGSGGAIAGAAAGWDEPFLVCNGDIITDLDLAAMIASHRERDAELSISLHEVEDPSPFGVVALDGDGRITRFVEKPPAGTAPSRLINAGTWLFQPSLLSEMDASRFNRVEDELFPALAAAGRGIFGFHRPGYWVDVGNPDAYLGVNLDLLRGEVPARLPDGWPPDGVMAPDCEIGEGAEMHAPLLLGPDTSVAAGARLQGPLVAGAGCTIGRNAVVRESVLWDGVTVEADAHVSGSVLATGVTVEAGAVVEGSVVAHDATVVAGARLTAGTRVEPGTVHTARAGAQ